MNVPKIYATESYVSLVYEDQAVRAIAEATWVFRRRDWQINRIVIYPALSRGNGVGSYLLGLLKAEVVKRHCERLLVVPGGYDADPVKQRNFYAKNGFSDKGGNVFEWLPNLDNGIPAWH